MKLKVAQDSSPKLVHEYSIYWAISELPGIPRVYWYGREGPYHVLVLDHLSSTFEAIVRTSTLNTSAVFTYATQMVSLFLPYNLCFCLFLSKLLILESWHNQHYVHLNIKPNNFMLGVGELSNQAFLINFGLAQLFCNPATCSYIRKSDGSSVTTKIEVPRKRATLVAKWVVTAWERQLNCL